MLLWSCGKYLQMGLKSAKRYRLSYFCVEGEVVADSLWSFFAAVSSQRDVKKRRAEPSSARAVCPWWGLLPSFVVMLQGLCCRAKRNLLALPTWVAPLAFFAFCSPLHVQNRAEEQKGTVHLLVPRWLCARLRRFLSTRA